jgi:multidrug efflux pump subunit AcrB
LAPWLRRTKCSILSRLAAKRAEEMKKSRRTTDGSGSGNKKTDAPQVQAAPKTKKADAPQVQAAFVQQCLQLTFSSKAQRP